MHQPPFSQPCSSPLTAHVLRRRHQVLAFAPDVVLLQEVDRSWYEQHWSPALRARGYDGAFAQKRHASSSEGLATFVRVAAWEPVAAKAVLFSSLLEEGQVARVAPAHRYRATTRARNSKCLAVPPGG